MSQKNWREHVCARWRHGVTLNVAKTENYSRAEEYRYAITTKQDVEKIMQVQKQCSLKQTPCTFYNKRDQFRATLH